MTQPPRIILIDPVDAIIIHNISVENKESAKRVNKYWHDLEETRGHEIERLLIRGATCELMARDDPVPVMVG